MQKTNLITIITILLISMSATQAYDLIYSDNTTHSGSAWGSYFYTGFNNTGNTYSYLEHNITLTIPSAAAGSAMKMYWDSNATSHGNEDAYLEWQTTNYDLKYEPNYDRTVSGVPSGTARTINLKVNYTAATFIMCYSGVNCTASRAYTNDGNGYFSAYWAADGGSFNITKYTVEGTSTPVGNGTVTVTVTSPTNTTHTSNNISINFDATTTVGSIANKWYNNGTANITYTTPTNLILANGSYAFKFYANNTNGVLGNTNVTFTINTTGGITGNATSILNASATGFSGGTRAQDYELVLNAFTKNNAVVKVITIGGTSYATAPWYTASNVCAEANIHAGCGAARTFNDYPMVTDEFSQIVLATSMSHNVSQETLMNQLINTINAITGSNGLPEWTVRFTNSGAWTIDTSCTSDDASDANARIITGLQAAYTNPNFNAGIINKATLNTTINNLCTAYKNNNFVTTAKTSLTNSSKTVRYYPRGGTNVGGMTNNDFMYTGYYGDNIIALGACYAHTNDSTYITYAQDAAQTWYDAANWTTSTSHPKFPPGRAFKWTSSTTPTAECTTVCTPTPYVDSPDGKRWTSYCAADWFYTNYLNITLHPWNTQYCQQVSNNTDNTNTAYVTEWYSNNAADQTYSTASDGAPENGLGIQVDMAGKPSRVTNRYTQIGTKWDAADQAFYGWDASSGYCMGLYEPSFALNSMGYSIGYLGAAYSAPVGGTGGTSNGTNTTSSNSTVTINAYQKFSNYAITNYTIIYNGTSYTNGQNVNITTGQQNVTFNKTGYAQQNATLTITNTTTTYNITNIYNTEINITVLNETGNPLTNYTTTISNINATESHNPTNNQYTLVYDIETPLTTTTYVIASNTSFTTPKNISDINWQAYAYNQATYNYLNITYADGTTLQTGEQACPVVYGGQYCYYNEPAQTKLVSEIIVYAKKGGSSGGCKAGIKNITYSEASSAHRAISNLTYLLTITSPNYSTHRINITPPNATSYYTFTLTPKNALNISYYDEQNNTLINYTTVSLDIIGTTTSTNTSTNTGHSYITGLPAGEYSLRYYTSTHQPRLTIFTIEENENYTINLKLLSATAGTNITITVKDKLDNILVGAIVKILKFNIATNSFEINQIVKTNYEGKTIANVLLNTEYYQFIVDYKNATVYTTESAYIYGTDIFLQIPVGFTGFDPYFKRQRLSGTIYHDKLENTTSFVYSDVSNTAAYGCLYTYLLSNTSRTLINTTCGTSSSGTVYQNLDAQNGATYAFIGTITTINDTVVDSLTVSYADKTTGGNDGMLFMILLMGIFASIGLWNLQVACVLVGLVPILFGTLGLVNLSIPVTAPMLLVALLIAYFVGEQR